MAIGSFKLPISSSSEWQRPTDWLTMPTVLETEDKFVGLYAIFPDGQNYAAFLFTTSAGQYRVDWGDGTITLHDSNTVAQYEYNYASISNSTLSSRGYKQAIITVTPVSGLLRTCNFQQRFVTSPVQNQAYATGFLDCTLSMPNASIGVSITFGGLTIKHSYVERFTIKTIGSITNLTSLFQDCFSVQSIPLFNTQNVTNVTNMFNGCLSLKSIPLLNTQNVTNMSFMFNGCSSLKSIPLLNTQNVTNMTAMFQSCVLLQGIPLLNTQNVTNMSAMFSNIFSIQSIPLILTSAITTSSGTDFSNTFNGCNSLDRIQMIFSRSVSMTNCQLSRTAIIEIFTNLVDRTSLTSANINITGNWGASALTAADRLIATNKNWTITG